MRLRIAVVAFAALGGAALTSTAASAMPNGIPKANEIVGQTSNIQQARWVSGPRGRRVWRTGPRIHVAVGPRRVWRPGWRGAYAWGARPAWGGAYAWSPGPVWGPQPAWRGTYAWGGPGPVWGPRPRWGWNSGWW
jgi:hypothetical protein